MTAYEPKMAKKTTYLDQNRKIMIIYILSIVEFPLKIQNISNYFIVILTQGGLYYFILLCFEIGG